jgi:hypothetical protein
MQIREITAVYYDNYTKPTTHSVSKYRVTDASSQSKKNVFNELRNYVLYFTCAQIKSSDVRVSAATFSCY